jgi:DNA-binding IclR family transcriptional regulator
VRGALGATRGSLKLVSLSHTALENLALREQARPFLQDLILKTGLTVYMAILEHAEAVIIEKVEAPGMLRLATWVGRRQPKRHSFLR